MFVSETKMPYIPIDARWTCIAETHAVRLYRWMPTFGICISKSYIVILLTFSVAVPETSSCELHQVGQIVPRQYPIDHIREKIVLHRRGHTFRIAAHRAHSRYLFQPFVQHSRVQSYRAVTPICLQGIRLRSCIGPRSQCVQQGDQVCHPLSDEGFPVCRAVIERRYSRFQYLASLYAAGSSVSPKPRRSAATHTVPLSIQHCI